MLFVNEGYENYDNVVEFSDNYVCLAKTSSVSADWQNPTTIDVIYQYFYPSTLTIESERTFSSSQEFDYIEVTTNTWERADCPSIITAGLLLTVLVCKVINMVTEFVEKGGII